VNLCVVKARPYGLTETFIQAHLERLPAKVTFAHGLENPQYNGRWSLSPSFAARLFRKARTIAFHEDEQTRITRVYTSLFRRIQADAVLAEYGVTGAHLYEATRRVDIPLIVHFHGYDASVREILDRYADRYRGMFHEAAAIIVVSQAMRARLLELGAPEKKVHVNCYGVDRQMFRPTDPAENPPVFLAVGRFVDKKAPYLTLLAFAEMLRHWPEARLRMIGDGPLLGVCRSMVVGMRLEKSVDLLGPQPHEVVASEMQRARAFVQHSIVAEDGDSEGTPVAVLEAGASGLPVVATRHAGIPDVVINEETGLLVEEHDVAGMARAMLRLACDPEEARRLGSAARHRVATHFHMEDSIHRLWQIICSCTDAAKRPETA
jgi:glycosyltransferase involved in cell wall biosynthesis